MTFKEWVDRSIRMTAQEEAFARFAWNAAIKACAEIAEETAAGRDADAIAEKIRAMGVMK